MQLTKIIKGIKNLLVAGDLNKEINNIVYDSRDVKPGDLFVCLKGLNYDGHKFIDEAMKKGAVAIYSQQKIKISKKIASIVTKDTRTDLAKLACNFFDKPSRKLITIGITGTKGKTTTAFMIKSILEDAGFKVGMIGTLGIIVDGKTIKMNNTTPESYEVQKYMREMVDKGCTHLVVEATSLGLKHHRLDGIKFNYGVFTNFDEDHIGVGEHDNLTDYLKSKSILFKNCKVGFFNRDDEKYLDMMSESKCISKTFGMNEQAHIMSNEYKLVHEPNFIGISCHVTGEIDCDLKIAVPGKFNIYNALAAVSVCNDMKIDKEHIINGIAKAKVKGRVEIIDNPYDFELIIDFAHNALSMKNIITNLREYNPNRIVTMFGAGGNRSKKRRYEVGKISGELSDLTVVTEDNSRYENVMDIIEDIKVGLDEVQGKYIVIPNRREAIEYCIKNAQPGDIVIFAGKGHEDYQEINGIKYPFDEHAIIQSILENMQEKGK